MKKEAFICYFATVGALTCFAVGLAVNLIVLAVLCAAAFAGCLVWFCKIIEKGETWSYKQIRKQSKKITALEDELRKLRGEIAGKADKQVDISRVRPGSRPSIAYQNMVVKRGEPHDSRAEDPSAS